MKKIGCITFHSSHNYGSCLQAYALQEFIKENYADYEYDIINFRSPIQKKIYNKPGKGNSILRNIAELFYFSSLSKKYKKFESFIQEKLNISEEFENEFEFENCYDVLLAGGDQIWNPRCTDFSWLYYFSGIKANCKISYAPSMGPHGGFLTSEEKVKIKEALSDFSLIGVRENGTKETICDILESSKEISVLPDPVLLLSSRKWELLFNDVKIDLKKPYIFFYTLNASYETYKAVKKIGQLLKMPVIVTKPTRKNDFFYFFSNYFSVGPIEFLKLIKDASFVVTTSFHACVFSAIFKKKFFAIDVHNDNRIRGFFEEYGLENCFLSSNDISLEAINTSSIDYRFFEKKIDEDKNNVIKFFNHVL